MPSLGRLRLALW